MSLLEERHEQLQNRTRIEILASILNVSHNRALKTHIMYKANLSHRQLEKYLGFLLQQGMVVKVTGENYDATTYQVTEKGINYLKDYERLTAYLKATAQP